ncbi:MAG: outer membrane lipoprotein chaperone LolA [Betaproteobacteria bacterium]|nr:outer membrane lipoprotein chaperone LolA [Betaproteobacteria bacterium]
MASLCPLPAAASSLDSLKSFLSDVKTGKAHFKQLVLDKKMTTVQESSGTMLFSRPGKFRWVYEKPYEQLIVGDGVKLWMYDVDLKQVTVKQMGRAIGSSPAALLAGNNEIEQHFNLKDLGRRGTLDWLEATPKDKESAFQSVRMGFSEKGLDVMELRDHFSQTTVIRFSEIERNPKISPDTFKFTPPKGADVISD